MSAGEPLDPALVAELEGIEDPQLAAAIQASYESQFGSSTAPPPPPPEADAELQRVLELSRLEAGNEEEKRNDPGGLSAAAPYGGSASSGSAAPPAAIGAPRSSASLAPPTHVDVEASSDRAVDGDSSRGSSRERGLAAMAEASIEEDREMAAAIEASYAALTEEARYSDEEDMLRRAMEMSRQEEERRQNQVLRENQDAELQESILMDQMREQEEKRRRIQEEEEQKAMIASQLAESQRQEEETRRRQARAAALPPEPAADEPARVDLQIRVLDGKRVRRRFLASHTLGQVYDFLDVEGHLGDSPEACVLISTMPRKQYEDRMQTLADAGLQGQCALILETTSGT
ncbi:FAS-associated factor 2-B [Symbiodinium microadriaticum]|uniref:FAS-associated factor 2-B n=1 Tax=Symbiodinium microadriaticum TaxID=2951 RepID=A0A1Q9EGD3_SYMMI|nr:FAS-associated factor 2-B [Symbiodinium microadriaticum]